MVKVELVIKLLTNPATTKTLRFINRSPLIGDASHFPLLQSYSGLNLEVGQDGLPTSGSGSITINDQWESYGKNRRVFDLFDTYTPINQAITIYRSNETIGDLDLPSSWTLVYTGKVESYSKAKDSISFTVSNSLTEQKIYSAIITEDLAATGYEVPTQSLGKALPIIFSDTPVIVPAYCLDWAEDTGGAARYAFASKIGTQFVVNPVDADIYIKDRDGIYRQINLVDTAGDGYVYGYPIGQSLFTDLGSYPTANGLNEFIIPFYLSSMGASGVLVSGVSWWCKGQNNGAINPVGQINFTIYRTKNLGIDTVNMTDWQEIATFDVAKSAYLTQVRGASNFWVDCDFDFPEILGGLGIDIDFDYRVYAVSFKLSNYTGSSTTDFVSGGTAGGTGTYFYRDTKGGNVTLGTGSTPLLRVKIVATEPNVSSTLDSKGMGYVYYNLTPKVSTCKVSELDMAIGVDKGLLDDGYGTITGTIGQAITRPDHVIKMLDYSWNGSNWTASNVLDVTTFSSLYSIFNSGSYQRKVTGFTEGDVTWLDLVSQIVKEMCCFLVPLSSGKLALWPWGNTGSVVKVFTDENILSVGTISESDPSTVINNIRIEYGKNFTQVFDQWEASGKPENLEGVVVINKGVSGYYNSLLANSESLYGKRELEESGSQFIGDLTSATTRALYFALRHEHTHRTFEIVVPYFENTDLKLMDIVDVLSVHLPNYYGTGFNAKYPTLNGLEIDPAQGEYWKQASRKRCQILGLRSDYDGTYPKLTILLREIKSRHLNDPTATNL